MHDTMEQEKALSRSQRRRRKDIVDAALEIFDRDGYEGARLDDVAAAAEVGKGTIYLYFKSKEELLEGVIHDVVRPAIDAVERAAAHRDRSATEILTSQIAVMGDRLGKGPMKTILRLMIAEGPRHESLRRFYYQQIVEPGMSAIRRCLADGEARGEFRRGSADLAPQVFAGPPLMAAVWRMLFQDLEPLDVERMLADHLRVALAGLQPPRQSQGLDGR